MQNPVLVEGTRGGAVEIKHHGSVCIVDSASNVVASVGDVDAVVFPRSAMKYFQVLPLLMEESLAEKYTNKEIAVMCASHNTEPMHVEVVRSVLKKGSVTESDLNCGPHRPMLASAADQLVRQGIAFSPIHNNCSGKHAGFLSVAKHFGQELKTYLNFDHPLQVTVRKIFAQMCEMPVEELVEGIDGCSAPNYGLPLRNLAIGFKNLSIQACETTALGVACKRVIDSVSEFPEMVGGTDRYCTDMMKICGSKVVGKLGAAGIYSCSFHKHHLGLAVKIDDGKMGPQYNVVQAIIKGSKLFAPEVLGPLEKYYVSDDLSCNGNPTGQYRTAAALQAFNVSNLFDLLANDHIAEQQTWERRPTS